MNHQIFLPNFNISLLQSQKVLPQKKLSSDSLVVSTEIVSSKRTNDLEIKFIVDSPFGQLQVSQFLNIQHSFDPSMISQISLQTQPIIKNEAANKGHIDSTLKSALKHEIGIYEDRDNAPSISATPFQDFAEERIIKNSPCTSTSFISAADEDQETEGERTTNLPEFFKGFEKKNSVKNILKAFGNFVQALDNEDEILDLLNYSSENSGFSSLEDVKKRYQRYNKSKSYNNSLICKIIQHKHYSVLFKLFITKYASVWLESSEVGDKQSHEAFINFCKNACENHDFLSCLKIIKKKHIKLSSN